MSIIGTISTVEVEIYADLELVAESKPIVYVRSEKRRYYWDGAAWVPSARVQAVNGRTGMVVLTKEDVGLGNADNTSDASKSVASAAKLLMARAINGVSFDGTADITIADASKEPLITGGATAQYWRGDKTWRDFGTDVRAALLTGLTTATSGAIAASDSVLAALGKLQKQIGDLATVARTGSYNDLTNKPAIPALNHYTVGGAANITKRWVGIIAPATAQNFTVDVSSAGFANILSVQMLAIKNATAATDCPQVSGKAISNTTITGNITQGSTTTVGVLGAVVNGLVFPASTAGVQISVVVEGN